MENQPNTNVNDNTTDFLEAIEELKRNTVPMDKYNKILEDNKRLIQTVTRNDERAREQEEAEKQEPKMTEEEFKKYLNIAASTSVNIPSHKRMDAIMKCADYMLENEGIDIFASEDAGFGTPEEAQLFREEMHEVLDSLDGPKYNLENQFNTELAGRIYK